MTHAPGRRPAIPAARTVPGLLDEIAARRPDAEFVVDGVRRLSWREARHESRRFARGLHALGVRAGDRVAILMGNRAEWLIADFAILTLGATMVSLNTWVSRRELTWMLENSGATVLVCTDRFLGQDYVAMLGDIARDGAAPVLRHVVRLEHDGRALSDGLCAGSRSWAEVMAAGDGVAESAIDAARDAVDPRDVAYILYTSGSTSTPKGVELQHFALVENMWHIGERMHLAEGERLWLAVSLFWAFGCENALLALMTHGGTVVLQEHFDPGEAIALIERERCTVIYATPNMVRAIADHPGCDRERLASLRTGATIGTPEQVRALAALGPHAICNVYGLTETYGNCAVTDAAWPLEERAACVGEPLPGVEIRIVDPDSGAVLPAGEVGEILVRGYLTCGYHRDPERTRASFDAQGFFITGDMGFVDGHGRLHFRGRRKEMIKTAGINVSPVEVEELLLTHPGVEQAYVVGLPDAERDEIVAAVVVPRAATPADEPSLRALCADALAAYKQPRRYLLLEAGALPLTSTGKVRKAGMPALFAGGAPRGGAR